MYASELQRHVRYGQNGPSGLWMFPAWCPLCQYPGRSLNSLRHLKVKAFFMWWTTAESLTIGRLAQAASVDLETIRYCQQRGLLSELTGSAGVLEMATRGK